MASVETKRMTAEEYLKLPEMPYPTELVRGEVVEMNVPTPRHGQICMRVGGLLFIYLQSHPHGQILSNDSGVLTEEDPDTVRGPDLSYYSFDRLPPGPIPPGYLGAIPELVFEVRSQTDRWADIHVKVGEYLRRGISYVCVVDDQTETVHVYQVNEAPWRLAGDDVLAFPDLLPVFEVPVSRFFE